jgi:chromate reductase, NAD(P)H dehydrogenase (quinone)
MATFKVLGICGSLRKHSTNMGLLRYAREHAPEGTEVTIADLSLMPFYNADIKEKPAPVVTLFQQIEQADALLFGCPEYNYSLAPPLKNAIDWASREPDNRLLGGMPVAMMGAGGGMGTSRSQYHLRQVCVFVDLHPLNRPEIFSNAFTGSFNDAGDLVNEKIQGLIVEQLVALKKWARKLRA